MKVHFWTAFTALCFGSIAAYADQLYVLNNNSNNVSIVDTVSNQTSLIPVGDLPAAIALAPKTKRLYVANRTDNTVTIIDIQTYVQKLVKVGSHPVGLFISPDEKRIYVLTEGARSISVIDVDTDNVHTIEIGAQPFFAAMAPQGKNLYVICYSSNFISVIDTTASALIDVFPIGSAGTNPTGIAILSSNQADEQIYLTIPGPHSIYENGSCVVINAKSHKLLASIPVEPAPNRVIIAPNGKQAVVINGVYSPHVHLIDTKTYITTLVSVGRRASYGVFSSKDMLYITNAGDNTVTAIDTQINRMVATIPVGFLPLHATIDSNGLLYVANREENTLSVIDTKNNTVINTIEVGMGPFMILP